MEGFLIRAWDLILPRWRWLYEALVGVSARYGAVSTRGTPPSSPVRKTYGRVYNPGMEPCRPQAPLAPATPSWAFHIVRGGNDAEEAPLSHLDLWKVSMDEKNCDPGMGPHSPWVELAGSMNSELGFPHRAWRGDTSV